MKNRSRTSYIGGTDIAPILGVSVFKTREQLMDEKLGRIVVKETPAMRRGKALERYVARMYKTESGISTLGPKMLEHAETPWLVANLDDHTADMVIEYKTAPAWSKNWKEGPPPDYILQVQHYMVMLGVQKAELFVLFSSDNFKEALAQVEVGAEDLFLDASKYSTDRILFEYDKDLMTEAYEQVALFWGELEKERQNADKSNDDNDFRGNSEGSGGDGLSQEGEQQPAP